ncbi:MAG: hypothetical protein IT236_15090 [Bacteroidia bacterium]|nr:hypothetical protein [Bacteroidia bacterium]
MRHFIPAILQKIIAMRFVLLAFTLILNLQTFAQARKMPVTVHFSLRVDTTKERVYHLHPKDENEAIKTVALKMKYGDSEIMNPEAASVLREVGCNIISVEVVYTDYQKQDVQDLLNRKRLTELFFLCPEVFTQSLTQWKYVEQLGYATEDDAKKLFHGIVIKYLKVPAYTPATAATLLGDIKNPRSRDTSFHHVFRKHIKFRDELVAVDFTGSMSPYYMQLLQWLYMNNNTRKLGFSFFNDGDSTADHLKRMGNVGGVYLFKTNAVDTIAKHAYRCMAGGFGGDTPENNIEALLKGVKQYPECKEVVMLVDNWADMRDYSMMAEVKLPVKVIVCGTNCYGIKSPVNPQYLELARKTGGSISTMEEELEDLGKRREGDEVSLEGVTYVIRSGKFMRKY